MNEVILETMKDNDDKFWHLQKQVDDLSWMVFQLEERIKATQEIITDARDKLERHLRALGQDPGPPIPKPNPKVEKAIKDYGGPLIAHMGKRIMEDAPGRVELREMLISACKEVYALWPRDTDEMERYDVFKAYMKAKGWDELKHVRAELWAQEHIKKFKNHELQEALRILGVME